MTECFHKTVVYVKCRKCDCENRICTECFQEIPID